MNIETCIFDTETAGLYGPMVILQYQFDDEPAVLYNPWLEPVGKTILLIERMVASRVVAHNLTFDWQKIQSFYCAIRRLAKSHAHDARPIEHVDSMVRHFYEGRNDFCLKPVAAVCTLLLCQKQVGGAALAMKEIRVRKIPNEAAPYVCHALNKNTNIPDIMFARRKTEREAWNIVENNEGDEWSDVVLKFSPSNALKDIAKLVLGVAEVQKLGKDLRPEEYPVEEGYAPYCNLLDEGGYWYTPKPKSGSKPMARKLWPLLLHEHLDFWNNDPNAVRYAMDDIVLLRKLYDHLGRPETDFDAEIACQVAVVRMAGFDIDWAKLGEGIMESQAHVDAAEINVDSPKQVKAYIMDALDPLEAHVVADGCAKAKLKAIIRTFTLEEREECCDDGCTRCGGTGFVGPGPMPVVDRARHILDVRLHRKRLQLYRKLEVARSAFPSFRVIGTKSGRMSGADGLNYHGIDSSQSIREVFNLTHPDSGWVVSGGDFDSQELAIMAATMNDDALSDDIATGKSLHAVFAAAASKIVSDTPMTYEQIMKNKSHDGPENVLYGKAKACVYALSYGAAEHKVAETIGCSDEEAREIMLKFFDKYVHMLQTRKQITDSLSCLVRSDEGRLQIRRPKQTYVDSCFGFRRVFNVEYAVIGAMVEAMGTMREYTKSNDALFKRQVIRKDNKGSQTIGGAISSALYGATFSVQNKIIRAALNHQIQSAGRTITLRCQKRIWDECQPVGIHPFQLKLMSVHDEIAATSSPEVAPKIADAIDAEITDLCNDIPLLGLEWNIDVGSWYGVKAAKGGRGMGFSRDAVGV